MPLDPEPRPILIGGILVTMLLILFAISLGSVLLVVWFGGGSITSETLPPDTVKDVPAASTLQPTNAARPSSTLVRSPGVTAAPRMPANTATITHQAETPTSEDTAPPSPALRSLVEATVSAATISPQLTA